MARNDPLSEYNTKRDFSRTKEPPGKRGRARKSSLSFLVQKHDARRLHYDLRLEWKGVLRSWAVTRGPSVDPADKRLAVMTEDHPMSYGDFEGVIPRGEYGGGTVMLWDRGTWEPLHDPEEGFRQGKLHFLLHGERMTGGWALVRMRRRNGEKRDNWLLIKERDEIAVDSGGDAIVRKNATSVVSGRPMHAIAADKDAVWSSHQTSAQNEAAAKKKRPRRPRGAKRPTDAPTPRFREPQLATLVEDAPEGDAWLHEVKFDGYRLMAAIGGKGVTLYTRKGLDWTERFPDVAKALEALKCDSALVDGEVVAADVPDGQSSFSALQKAIKAGGAMRFYAFDLLSLDGEELTKERLVDRKKRLQALLKSVEGTMLQYSEHVTGHGAAVYRSICNAGQEGIVSKRADAVYRGTRGRSWLKVKCIKRQEFIIGGFSRSDKKGRPFASLLLGTLEDGKLVYRGRVGTGYSGGTLESLGASLKQRVRKSTPFDSVPRESRGNATWVAPDLIAEIDFAELTDDGHIRHGAFLGLRNDKEAEDVTLETKEPARSPKGKVKRAETSNSGRSGGKQKPRAPSSDADTGPSEVLGIRISNPGRVVYPQQGVTKIDLARYYAVVSERMLPLARRHPVSLVRCPQGRSKHCFYQKHASDGFPEAIRQAPIKESSGEVEDYLYIADAEGLVAAVQMGTLEFHIWGSTINALDKPNRLVFDFDPDESLSFDDVREAAIEMRGKLEEIGLKSVPMVTGGKGVHVIVPLMRRAPWEEVKAFAKGFASAIAEDEPERFVATMSKAKRKGRIFIDWLRNERGATAIAPYSTRARQGAPIATPVSWDELPNLDGANTFSMADVVERLEQADPWADAAKWRQSVTKAMLRRFPA